MAAAAALVLAAEDVVAAVAVLVAVELVVVAAVAAVVAVAAAAAAVAAVAAAAAAVAAVAMAAMAAAVEDTMAVAAMAAMAVAAMAAAVVDATASAAVDAMAAAAEDATASVAVDAMVADVRLEMRAASIPMLRMQEEVHHKPSQLYPISSKTCSSFMQLGLDMMMWAFQVLREHFTPPTSWFLEMGRKPSKKLFWDVLGSRYASRTN